MPRRKKTEAQPNDKIQEKAEFQPPQLDHPRLNEWVPEDDDLKFIYVDEKVHARFSDIFGKQFPKFETFKINKKHYKERMTDVCMHINYFMRYYDTKHDFLINVASVKYLIDRNPGMRPNQFKNVLIRTVVTKDFVHDMIHMAKDLRDGTLIDGLDADLQLHQPRPQCPEKCQFLLCQKIRRNLKMEIGHAPVALTDKAPDLHGVPVVAVKGAVHKFDLGHPVVDKKLQFPLYQIRAPKPQAFVHR